MIPRYTRPKWPTSGRRNPNTASGSRSRPTPPTSWPSWAWCPLTPQAVWKAKDMTFDVDRIDEIEAEVKHDVIAFLTHLAELVGEDARFVHQGLTSSDVLDTCLAVQLKRAADLLLEGMDRVLAALKKRAFRAQDDRLHRPQPRHPRRAHHDGAEIRALLCRVRPQPRTPGSRVKRSPPAPSPAPSAPSPM
jgi:hypothetical protein